MPELCIKNVKIAAISTVVPSQELRLADDKNLYGGNEKQLRRVMKSSGFNARRVASASTTTSDLCQKAAEILFKEYSVNREDISAVIFVTQTPDYPMPATACLLADKLKLTNNVAAFDINQGCAGFTYALWVGGALLNKNCSKILLLVGDTPTKYTDMFKDGSAPIFGDAGTATLLEYDENADPMYFDIGTDGSNFDAIIAENGGFRNPPQPSFFYENQKFAYNAKMDGMRVMEFTLDRVPKSITKVLQNSHVDKSEIDWFVMHQANKIILTNVAANANLDLEKVPMETLSVFGNQSSASIPCALCYQLRDKLSGKHKVLFCGFGIGLCWVSCIATLDNVYCSKVYNYEEI